MHPDLRGGTVRYDPESLREVTAAAAEIFTEPPRRAAAIAYLKQRGIDATALGPEWLIGYAPPGWTRLLDRLHDRFSDAALLDAGLVRRCSRGSLIDTFRERVIFGIRDLDGTLAGFIGRDLSGSQNAPKYLNTHQHALFDKSTLLFGLHEGACQPNARQPVVVEGPLDVLAIAARQRADGEELLLPVAASGTAFTASHARRAAELARRHRSPVLVAFDGDAAGRAAALSAGDRLHQAGADVRIAVLPNGVDPADYLARFGSRLDTFRADQGLPLINLHVENAIIGQGDTMQWPEGRLAALRQVTSHLTSYPPEYTARQVGWIAEALQLNPSTVTLQLADAFSRSPEVGPHRDGSIAL